jgi:hypothetical protein
MEAGEFDTVFDERARKPLMQEAKTAARAKGAEAAAAARARRRALEFGLAEDLKTLAETGAGDAALPAARCNSRNFIDNGFCSLRGGDRTAARERPIDNA